MAATTGDRRRLARKDRARSLAVTSVLVPPVAWVASLGLSYAIQDFTCTAALSAGSVVAEEGLRWLLLVLNVVLLAATVVAGIAGHRAGRDGPEPVASTVFLGRLGLYLAVLFGFGIVLIAVNPLVLEVCG